MSELKILDPAAIERLFRLGGQKFTLDMIDLFDSYGSKQIAEARRAWHAGDLPALAKAAHPLKSSAGNVGAVQVQELAGQVESAAAEQNTSLAGARFNELERAFAVAQIQLAAERVRRTQPPA